MFFMIAIVLVYSVRFFSVFFSVGKKGAADYFKDDILTSLKENDSIKFDLRVALNCVREKGKPWLKNTY